MCGFLSLVLIALVLFQGGLSQLLDDECGGPLVLTYRIVNGRNETMAPFMASVYNGTKFMCGGTLINKGYVLSAAHCFENITEVNVHLGEIDRSCSAEDCPHVQRRNAKAINHPGFTRSRYSDIALLKLYSEVTFNELIRPICIILDKEVTSDGIDTFTAYGWGFTEKKILSDRLRSVTLSRSNRCSYNICAGGDSRDTCHGDSGGPLAANTTYRGRSRFVQYGVVSGGAPNCTGEGIYTDVNRFKLWIANTMLESKPRLFTENCSSDWGSKVLVRLWEMSLFEYSFKGALITNEFVLTVASAFPSNVGKMQVESITMFTYDVAWFHLHPEFTSYPSIKNNIAVIKLANKVPRSVVVTPICMGLNLDTPTTWNAFLNRDLKGYQSVDLRKIDNCYTETGLPVEPDQICIEKPNPSEYEPLDRPGSVIGRIQTFKGSEKYLIAGIISHTQDDVIIVTNIQKHQKWIANELKG